MLFRSFTTTSKTPPQSSSPQALYGTILPWQVAQVAREPGSSLPGTTRTDLPVETAQSRTLRQVDNMMQELDEKKGMWRDFSRSDTTNSGMTA